MATRRKSTKRATGRAPARRKATRAKGRRAQGRAQGSRQTRSAQSAREVRAQERAAASHLRLAEPPVVAEGTGLPSFAEREAADREAAELAARIEATVGSAADTLRFGPESAPDRLREHRDAMEEAAARRREAHGELPGAAALALELAAGALRLVGAMVAAPFRIGLAFLRRAGANV